MEIIRALIQDLVVIVILAMFLEILLPAGDLRRFVKMVMGLLIIVAVVQAVGELARWDGTGDLTALTGQAGPDRLAAIIASGEKISQAQEEKALEQYRRGLANQVVALAGMNKEIPVAAAEVIVNTEKETVNYGQINKIIIFIGQAPGTADRPPAADKTAGIEPVTVQIGPEPGTAEQAGAAPEPPEEAVAGLIQTVANFYNLKQEQVQCIYR